VELGAFEVVMLHVQPEDEAAPVPGAALGGARHGYQRIPVSFSETACSTVSWSNPEMTETLRMAVNGRSQYLDSEDAFARAGAVTEELDRDVVERRYAAGFGLPPSEDARELVLVLRFSRDGVSWNHHALHRIVNVRVWLYGVETPLESMQQRWHEQAGAWPWILYRANLAAARHGSFARCRVTACLPRTVSLEGSVYLQEPWDGRNVREGTARPSSEGPNLIGRSP